MLPGTKSILSDIRICFTHHHYECLIKQKVLLSSHLGNIYLKFFYNLKFHLVKAEDYLKCEFKLYRFIRSMTSHGQEY